MSEKQDRTAARTAADIERKYNFGKSFAEVMGIATDAQKTAGEAQKIASNPAQKLTHEEVFNLLTNNGATQGIFRGEDGEIYINASYLRSGVISSEDGTIRIDLSKGSTQPVFNTGISTNGILIRADEANLAQLAQIQAYKLNDNGDYFLYAVCNSVTGNELVVLTESFTDNYTVPVGVTMEWLNQDSTRAALITTDLNRAGFWVKQEGKTVGSFLVGSDGSSVLTAQRINPGKKVLFTGSVAKGETFTVPNTAYYDLFAIKVSVASAEKPGVILAYKDGNTIHGMGGWGGDSATRKETYWISIEFEDDTWTLVHGSCHDVSLATGAWSAGVEIKVLEVIGVI